jgi:hypothetical protein|uniref:Uncharacterized protein n=1 Tax=Picea glauca TaxID=3330 RepID=A0A124GP60_PICGL|nr:hypothetical protein ABT39_MTgene794 [Picea glauca]
MMMRFHNQLIKIRLEMGLIQYNPINGVYYPYSDSMGHGKRNPDPIHVDQTRL